MCRNASILLDGETERMYREGFGTLVEMCDYLKCGQTFATAFTGVADLLGAMKHLLDARGSRKWVITTLGSQGSILMTRKENFQESSCVVVSNWKDDLLPQIEQLEKSRTTNESFFSYFEYANNPIIYCSRYIPPDPIVNTTGIFQLNKHRLSP
jgi:hypothetical protein